MYGFTDWFVRAAIAIIPGTINVFVASEELVERCRILPFFEPFKSPGVWLWFGLQFLFPSVLYAAMFSPLSAAINTRLVLEAIGFGVGFTTLLNASIPIGSRTYSIKPIYDLFVQRVYNLIRDSEQGDRALEFWAAAEDALTDSADLSDGFQYLENYFARETSFSLRPVENFEEKLTKARTESSKSEQVKLVKSLIQKVRREKLYDVLLAFNCSQIFLKRYFPRQFRRKVVVDEGMGG